MDLQGIADKAKELFDGTIGKMIMPLIEAKVKEEIEKQSDGLVELAVNKLSELIPGQIDDAILGQMKPALQKEFKAFLLSQADKIS